MGAVVHVISHLPVTGLPFLSTSPGRFTGRSRSIQQLWCVVASKFSQLYISTLVSRSLLLCNSSRDAASRVADSLRVGYQSTTPIHPPCLAFKSTTQSTHSQVNFEELQQRGCDITISGFVSVLPRIPCTTNLPSIAETPIIKSALNTCNSTRLSYHSVRFRICLAICQPPHFPEQSTIHNTTCHLNPPISSCDITLLDSTAREDPVVSLITFPHGLF